MLEQKKGQLMTEAWKNSGFTSRIVLPLTAVSRNGEVWILCRIWKVLIKSFGYIC
jgi:hypothetical protein